jgi:signal transduction histidine kinase
MHSSLEVDARHPFVFADYYALVQAFRNLVRNAVEARADGGTASLQITIGEEAESLLITVADNGRGFREIVPEHVFEPDYTSKAHGTGLGLAIVRQTIRAHNGDIVARAAANGGAEFIIRLPRMKEEDVAS